MRDLKSPGASRIYAMSDCCTVRWTQGMPPLLAPLTSTEGSCVENAIKQNSNLSPHRQKTQGLPPLLALFTRTDGGAAGNDIGQTSSLLHLLPLLALPTSTETRIVGNGLGQNSRPLRHRCSPTGLDLAATRARSLLAAAFKAPRFTTSSKLRALTAAALSTKELA